MSNNWLPVVVAGGAAAGICYIAWATVQQAIRDATEAEEAARRGAESAAASRPKPLFTRATNGPAGAPQPRPATTASSTSGAPSPSTPPAQQRRANEPSAPGSPAGSSKQSCDQCGRAAAGPLARCTRCKSAHYCGLHCQKQAWPKHKAECGRLASKSASASGSAGAAAGAPASGSADAADAAGGCAAPAAAACADGAPGAQQPHTTAGASGSSSPMGAAGSGGSGGERDGADAQEASSADVLSALGAYLTTHAEAAADDPLRAQFEAGVVAFVRGDYRGAVRQLTGVHAAAVAAGAGAGAAPLAGDCLRWLGHAHNRLADPGRAAACFAQGCELAQARGDKKLAVECLSGLGCMYRAQGELQQALGYLSAALGIAEELGDEPTRASALVNLGAVQMGVPGERGAAVANLCEAVALREAQVVALHEAGESRGLATAIMEHAGALVNLASAQYVSQEYKQAEGSYLRALQVFDLVDDVDKLAKTLVNLANLCELQLHEEPDARQRAAEHRARLFELSERSLQRAPPEHCSICLEALQPLQPSSEEGKLLLLACLHCFHHRCWQQWSETQSSCPNCKQPVPVF